MVIFRHKDSESSQLPRSTFVPLIVLILVVLAVGCASAATLTVPNNTPLPAYASTRTSTPPAEMDVEQKATSVVMRVPGPATIQELVNRADTIVIGNLGPVVQAGIEEPYEGFLPKDSGPGAPQPALTFTHFQINVEEMILNDGLIQPESTLRVAGMPGTLGPRISPSDSHRYLMALVRNPDDKSYGVGGGWGLLIISGDKVTLSDQERTTPEFAGTQTETREFIQAVRDSATTRKHVPPSEWWNVNVETRREH